MVEAEEADKEETSEVKEEDVDNTVEDEEMLEEDEEVEVTKEVKEEPKVAETPSPVRQTRNTGNVTPAKNGSGPVAKAKRGRK